MARVKQLTLDEMERDGFEVVQDPGEDPRGVEDAAPYGQGESTALIAITQLPEIRENLRSLKAHWEEKVRDADALLCSEESVQSIKASRAELRREFEEADEKRKAAKARYMAAWNELETVWKDCVLQSYNTADETYKSKIAAFEGKLKASCIEELQRYYAELQQVEELEWLPFQRAMQLGKITVSLSDAKSRSARRVKDELAHVVSSVALVVEQIRRMEDSDAIMAEYKVTLDAGAAVAAVQERRRREAQEREESARRQEMERMRAEAIAKVRAAAPQVAAPPAVCEKEKVFPKFTFAVYGCTKTQLIKIREYLKQEGIRYE